jgi:flavodoxin
MKALIIYHSKTGITREFAYEITQYLKENSHVTEMKNILDVQPEDFSNADTVFIGCWTSGLFFFLQHPDNIWKENALRFPELNGKKIAFFTTYKVATGSMFSKMQKVLDKKLTLPVTLNLKSKNGKLADNHKEQINLFIS